jgi:hypothetical protein
VGWASLALSQTWFNAGPKMSASSLVASLHPNCRRTRYSPAGETESAIKTAIMAPEIMIASGMFLVKIMVSAKITNQLMMTVITSMIIIPAPPNELKF